MQQINENLVVISPGDPYDITYNNFLKIFLSGTIDLNVSDTRLPWQQKFINGLAAVTSPGAQYANFKFLVMNPYMKAQNPSATLDNQEYVQKVQWELQNQEAADVIFCNFLKRSTQVSAIQGFLLNAKSGKLVTRCPLECMFYPQIKLISDMYQIPLVGDSDSGLGVLQMMFNSIPRFKDLMNFNLGI